MSGYSASEIAETLGISLAITYNRLYKINIYTDGRLNKNVGT